MFKYSQQVCISSSGVKALELSPFFNDDLISLGVPILSGLEKTFFRFSFIKNQAEVASKIWPIRVDPFSFRDKWPPSEMPLPCVCIWRRKWCVGLGGGDAPQAGSCGQVSITLHPTARATLGISSGLTGMQCLLQGFLLTLPAELLLTYSETPQHAFQVLITAFTPLYCALGILCFCLQSSSFPARSICHSSLCSPPKLVASKVGVSDLENNFVVTSGERWGEGIDWEFGIDKYTMLYSE